MAARKPQDHKPKAVEPKAVKTDTGWDVVHRGVEFSLDADALDDFELLRDIGLMSDDGADDSRKLLAVPGLFDRLFGPKTGRKVLDALREPSGRVKIETASTFFFEVFRALNPESQP
jgi:hypothetical protein